jgi:hypothetical protein
MAGLLAYAAPYIVMAPILFALVWRGAGSVMNTAPDAPSSNLGAEKFEETI